MDGSPYVPSLVFISSVTIKSTLGLLDTTKLKNIAVRATKICALVLNCRW